MTVEMGPKPNNLMEVLKAYLAMLEKVGKNEAEMERVRHSIQKLEPKTHTAPLKDSAHTPSSTPKLEAQIQKENRLVISSQRSNLADLLDNGEIIPRVAPIEEALSILAGNPELAKDPVILEALMYRVRNSIKSSEPENVKASFQFIGRLRDRLLKARADEGHDFTVKDLEAFNDGKKRKELEEKNPNAWIAINNINQLALGEASGRMPTPGPIPPRNIEFYNPANPADLVEPTDFQDQTQYADFVRKATQINDLLSGPLAGNFGSDGEWLKGQYIDFSGYNTMDPQKRQYFANKFADMMKGSRESRDANLYRQDSLARSMGSDWIWDTDKTTGNPVIPVDLPPQAMAALEEARQAGIGNRMDEFDHAYKRLGTLSSFESDLDQGVKDQIDHYRKKMVDRFETMIADNQRSADFISKVEDPLQRDEAFYEMLKELNDEPNRSARDIIDLNKQHQINIFMNYLDKLHFTPEQVVYYRAKDWSIEKVRRMIKNHYQSQLQALVANHDIDYYSRAATGDMKSYKTAVHYYQNEFALDAFYDPIKQAYMQANEQALLEIMNNNNGYIPPDLVTYDPVRKEVFWDERTRDIVRAKIEAGAIKDIKRDDAGLGMYDENGRYLYEAEAMTLEEFERKYYTMNSALTSAKGMNLLTMRTLEIFSRSKTPGVNSRIFGTTPGEGPAFSSIGYEGIARHLSPLKDFMMKYQMPGLEHKAFFAFLLGADGKDPNGLMQVLMHDPAEWQKIMYAEAEGTLRPYLEEKYGDRIAHALGNAFDLFQFSGAEGPMSGWRENDMTIGWSDKKREREGGAMRLAKARRWAERQVRGPWEEKQMQHLETRWSIMTPDERLNARDKYAGSLDRMWLEANIDPKERHRIDHEISHYMEAYRTYVWVQMAERSPLIYAAHIDVLDRTFMSRGQAIPKNLRAVALEDILANDAATREILLRMNPSATGAGLKLDMIRDTRQEKTPDYNHRCLYARIGVLDHDLEAVQQLALYGGIDRAPRNIRDSDFDTAISMEQKIYVDGKYVRTITVAERRIQAREYYKIIRKRLLGNRTGDQWMQALGVSYDTNGKLLMSHADNVDSILSGARGALLDKKLAKRTFAVHMGTGDSQRDMYDWPSLGSRHWARRGNDLEAWYNASMIQIKLLNEVKAQPDKKALLKGIEELFAAEQEHDPAKSEMKVWLWAGAIAQMYREGPTGKIPIIGRVLPKLGVPVSVMQHIKSADSAASWSANNCHEWAEEVANVGHLSSKEIAKDGSYHPFNQESMEKWIGGTKAVALMEFLLIGGALILTATASAAFIKGLGDTSDEKSSH